MEALNYGKFADKKKLQEVKDRVKEEILKHPLYNRLVLPYHLNEEMFDNSLATLLSYLDDALSCEKCCSLKSCLKSPARKGMSSKLSIYNEKELTLSFTFCPKRVGVEELRKLFTLCRYEEDDFILSIEEETKDARMKGIKKASELAAESYERAAFSSLIMFQKLLNKSSLGYIIVSPNLHLATNLGKGLLNDMMKSSKSSGIQLPMSELVSLYSARDFASVAQLEELKKIIFDVPFLFISDAGIEYRSTFFRDIFLYPLLSSRKNKKLVTIISSSETPLAYCKSFNQTKNQESGSLQLFNLFNEYDKVSFNDLG